MLNEPESVVTSKRTTRIFKELSELVNIQYHVNNFLTLGAVAWNGNKAWEDYSSTGLSLFLTSALTQSARQMKGDISTCGHNWSPRLLILPT
jgi:hypothetical protein